MRFSELLCAVPPSCPRRLQFCSTVPMALLSGCPTQPSWNLTDRQQKGDLPGCDFLPESLVKPPHVKMNFRVNYFCLFSFSCHWYNLQIPLWFRGSGLKITLGQSERNVLFTEKFLIPYLVSAFQSCTGRFVNIGAHSHAAYVYKDFCFQDSGKPGLGVVKQICDCSNN